MQTDDTIERLVEGPDQVASRSEAVSLTGSKRRLIQLDFTRGLAILLVMGYHFIAIQTNVRIFNAAIWPFKKFGWAGVDLFFVLSGFLVGGLLIGEIYRTGALRIGRFIKRRGFKIWPAYYAYLLFQVATRHFPPSTYLVQNLLHLQNYLGTSLSHTWTLAVEEHFYLLLPLLLVGVNRSERLRGRLVAMLASICVAILIIRSSMVFFLGSTRVWEYTHTRLDSLAFGVLLSHLYYHHSDAFAALCKRRAVLSLISVCGIVFLSLVGETSTTMHTIGYTVNYLCMGSFLLLMVGIDGAALKWLPYRSVAVIGLYSYSIYLWHLAVRTPLLNLSYKVHMANGFRWIVLMTAQYASAIVLGVVMSKLIEWPFLRLRERVVPG
jgi:peptidoglycan/LPS O-acetylase OafA/YrhL